MPESLFRKEKERRSRGRRRKGGEGAAPLRRRPVQLKVVAAPLDPMSPAGRLGRRTGGTHRAGAAKEGRPWRIQEQHAVAAKPALLRRRTEETAAA
jgi:hypothetical protein